MSDAIDMAQLFEAQHRDKSLTLLSRTNATPPVVIDGVSCCAECEDPIPLARLKALPGVGLCVACQAVQEKEQEHGQEQEQDD